MVDFILLVAVAAQVSILSAVIARIGYVAASNAMAIRYAKRHAPEGWCMCGDRIDSHGYSSNHAPVDQYDYCLSGLWKQY